jgi:hypothetical protein
MATLQHAFLNNDDFNTISTDFFNGLPDLLEISLGNPCLNASCDGSEGWALPLTLADFVQQLQVLSLDNGNLIGTIPDFLGCLISLQYQAKPTMPRCSRSRGEAAMRRQA